jgi:YVTN family beta-propeller protein
MKFTLRASCLLAIIAATAANAGQSPGALKDPDIPISHRDRVFAAEQFSNTVSVVDPASDTLLGVIRLGDPQPQNFSPLYRGQVLVHGMGISPDDGTIAVVSIGSNSVTFIDTATNAVKHTVYVGRSPHEAAFTRDGAEAWVTVRGENYLSVIDAKTFEETARITTPNGPGMVVFSPDGVYAYVCSSFTPETDVITVKDRRIVASLPQASPFCPNIAVTADGDQVWYTLKDTGAVTVFNARPPFNTLKQMTTGPITNHVNFVDNAHGKFAYVTVGGLNLVRVFRRNDFSEVATIPVGKLPHGIWPSGDGTRVYVGLENDDRLTAIDTLHNTVIADIPIGQAPQALVYAPGAVTAGTAVQGLAPLGVAGEAAHLTLGAPGRQAAAPTSVSLFEQGLTQCCRPRSTAWRRAATSSWRSPSDPTAAVSCSRWRASSPIRPAPRSSTRAARSGNSSWTDRSRRRGGTSSSSPERPPRSAPSSRSSALTDRASQPTASAATAAAARAMAFTTG